jgi:hypothetical protein
MVVAQPGRPTTAPVSSTSAPRRRHLTAQRVERAVEHRGPGALDEAQRPVEVVHRDQAPAGGLAHDQEVTEVGAGVPGAGGAPAGGVEGTVVEGVVGALQVEPTGVRSGRSRAGRAGGQHAVEEVGAERDRLHHAHGIAQAHHVPGLVLWELAQGHLQRRRAWRRGPRPRRARRRRSRRSRRPRCAGRSRSAGRSVPPWTIPSWASSGRSSARKAFRARAAQAEVRSTARRRTSGGDGSGGHTSSTICRSAPSRAWISTAPSGVRRWVLPS